MAGLVLGGSLMGDAAGCGRLYRSTDRATGKVTAALQPHAIVVRCTSRASRIAYAFDDWIVAVLAHDSRERTSVTDERPRLLLGEPAPSQPAAVHGVVDLVQVEHRGIRAPRALRGGDRVVHKRVILRESGNHASQRGPGITGEPGAARVGRGARR